jgi:methylglutaconyl-CoA hydratase
MYPWPKDINPMTGHVHVHYQDTVATVSFFHPQSNSLPGSLLRELATTIELVGKNNSIHVVVIRSEGEKAFCAGASFDELVSIETAEQGDHFFSGFALVINAMRNCPKLIIGRVHNKAVGGGVGIAASVDYCFATSNSSVKLSELAVGIGPFVVGPAVQRKIGLSAMSELAIDATSWRSAEWAQQKGLFTGVYSTEGDMDEAIEKLTKTLAKSSPEAMLALKQVFWEGTENWSQLLFERAKISGRLVLSDFTKNAISAFKNK